MAALAREPFYGAPRRASEGAPGDLSEYVEALERMAREEEQKSANVANRTDAARWRVKELLAAARRAERIAREQGSGVSQGYVAQLTQTMPRSKRARGMDEYWDDYLYAGLEARSKDQSTDDDAPAADAPSDAALKEEYGARAPSAAPPTPSPVSPAAPSEKAAEPTLQSDAQVHDALSSELLRMAGVLKRNTAAFGDALERDRVLVEQAGSRLDQNLSLMTRTRGQLGVFSKKARSMGWFTILSMAMVFVSWVVMYIVIRLT